MFDHLANQAAFCGTFTNTYLGLEFVDVYCRQEDEKYSLWVGLL